MMTSDLRNQINDLGATVRSNKIAGPKGRTRQAVRRLDVNIRKKRKLLVKQCEDG